MATKRLFSHHYLLTLIAAVACATPVLAQQRPEATAATNSPLVSSTGLAVNYRVSQPTQRLEMRVNSSRILTLEKKIPLIQVQNEALLVANPISANQIQVSAQATGVTQLNLWDEDDTLYTIDVIVTGDSRELEMMLAEQFPLANLSVSTVPGGAVVGGTVSRVDDVDRAVQVAEQFYPNIVNNIEVVGVQQILLHTKVLEVSRSKLRSHGIDLGYLTPDKLIVHGVSGLLSPSGSSLGGITPAGSSGNFRYGVVHGGNTFDALLQSLRQNDLVKVLAEPTLVATHGRAARFTSGERFPIAVPSGNGSVAIQFEEVGTIVDFVPIVLGPGRLRLEVRPEISEINPARSVTIANSTIPGIRQRYVDTAVEMNAGQTLAIAGLIQTRTEATVQALPFFGELPWVGSFFRRVNHVENDIEMLVLVTPEMVDAMDPCQVPAGGPGLNSRSPSDKELYWKGFIEVPAVNDPCMICPEPQMMEEYGPEMLQPPAGVPYGAMQNDAPPTNVVMPPPSEVYINR